MSTWKADGSHWQPARKTDAEIRAEVQREVDELDRQAIADEQRETRQRQEREQARVTRVAPNQGAGSGSASLRHKANGPVYGKERPVYGPGSSWDWMYDLCRSQTAHTAVIPSRDPDFSLAACRGRLEANERYMGEVGRGGSDEERELIRGLYVERYRKSHGTSNDFSRRDWSAAVGARSQLRDELRDVSTGTMAFTPPLYLLQRWLKYRTAAAPVAAQSQQGVLPATGMQVNVPIVTSGITAESQTENSSTNPSSPTATFVTVNVETLASSVELSQQTIDRSGIAITDVFADQAARNIGTQLDELAIQAALTAPGGIVNNGSVGIEELYADLGKAASIIETTEGTRFAATHVFMPPALLRWYTSQLDNQDRPIFTPTPSAGNGVAGEPDTAEEGYLGFTFAGLRAFADANMSAASAGYNGLLVGDFPYGLLVLTGAPIFDLYPEFQPATLTAIFTARQYVAVVPLYESAFVSVTGTAYPATPSWVDA